MKRKLIISTLIMGGFFQPAMSQTDNGNNGHKWQLVWSDEFNYTGMPDSTKWSYDVGGHGWGNHEKQYYTEKKLQNANVNNGVLNIIVVKENFKDAAYTSARLVSKHKGDWKYGHIEVKAKLPRGRGLWSAIWMLSTDWKYGGWPMSGEIDILEHVGYLKDSVFGTVHTGAYNHKIRTHKGNNLFSEDVADDFHLYTLEWDENKIEIFFDKKLFFTFKNEKKTEQEWPFDQRFHLLLNIAVGGDWGGKEGIDDSIFPQKMQVDYVRIYQ